jgi:hypothetical protein
MLFLQGIAGMVAVAIAMWAFFLWFERSQLFKPTREINETPATFGVEFEDVAFVAEDGCLLHGWWMPHPQARGTLLYCHGNADNVSGRAEICARVHALGVNVFLFDYRGYGRSRGRPSEHGTYRDARAAYEVVRARHHDAEDPPVVVYGVSLGGAVAIQLALDRPVKGLIVENTFTSIAEMGDRLYPWLPVRLLGQARYASLDKVTRLAAPSLWAHSVEDELIPVDMGRRLFSAAGGPKRWVNLRGAHGEGGWKEDAAYLRTVDEFLHRVLGPLPAPQ